MWSRASQVRSHRSSEGGSLPAQNRRAGSTHAGEVTDVWKLDVPGRIIG